jgi:hypothetical protein
MPSDVDKRCPNVLLWADLTLEHLDSFYQCRTVEDKLRLIGELFQLEDFEINLKSGIVVDLYFYTLQYRIIHCVLNMKHSQLLYSWPGLLKRMALIMSKLLLSFQL